MIKTRNFKDLPLMVLSFFLLFYLQVTNFLLFHTFAELTSIAIALSFFMVSWHTKSYSEDQALAFLGTVYLFISILDVFHTLSYQGIAIFDEKYFFANQIWVLTRFLEATALLIFSIIYGKKIKINFSVVYAVLSFFTMASILSVFHFKIFPVCFVAGEGQTLFKVLAEFFIVLILLMALFQIKKLKADFHPFIYKMMFLSILFTIASELSFTLYSDNHGIMNSIGHYLKIISFYCIYKSIIREGLQDPFRLIYNRVKEREEELYIANQDKDKFISIIAHDLRGPFSAIMEFSNFLVKEDIDSEEIKHYFTLIRDSGLQIMNLLEDLLIWGKASTDRMIIHTERVSINKQLESVYSLFKHMAEKKNIQLINSLDSELFVHCDASLVHTVLRNLVNNAIKFTPNNGRIYVSGECLGTETIISVIDTGVGISDKDKQQFFQTGSKVNNYGTEGEQGSGLGLLIVKELVEKSGGKVSIENNPNLQGTIAKFTLPTYNACE